MHSGLWYKSNGETVSVTPANRRGFTLAELQGFVGGSIEHVQLSHGVMYCNESGVLLGLPYNENASRHANADKWWRGMAYLVGDVIFYTGNGKVRA